MNKENNKKVRFSPEVIKLLSKCWSFPPMGNDRYNTLCPQCGNPWNIHMNYNKQL